MKCFWGHKIWLWHVTVVTNKNCVLGSRWTLNFHPSHLQPTLHDRCGQVVISVSPWPILSLMLQCIVARSVEMWKLRHDFFTYIMLLSTRAICCAPCHGPDGWTDGKPFLPLAKKVDGKNRFRKYANLPLALCEFQLSKVVVAIFSLITLKKMELRTNHNN